MNRLMSFFRSVKVTFSTIVVLIGAGLLAAPFYTALLPVEFQSLLVGLTGTLLNLLLVAGVVYMFFNWMFDSWRYGKKFVSTINLMVGLAVIVLGAGLLVNSYILGLWTGVFGPEHACMLALIALGAGLADRSYVNIRYLTGKPAAPARERLAPPTVVREMTKEEVVADTEEDLGDVAEAKLAELTK